MTANPIGQVVKVAPAPIRRRISQFALHASPAVAGCLVLGAFFLGGVSAGVACAALTLLGAALAGPIGMLMGAAMVPLFLVFRAVH